MAGPFRTQHPHNSNLFKKIQNQSWQCWIVNKQASMPFLGSVLGSSRCWVRGSIHHERSAEMFLPQLQRLQEKYNLNASPCSNFEQIFCHPPATSHNFIGTTDISHLVYICLFYCCSLYLAHCSSHKILGSTRGWPCLLLSHAPLWVVSRGLTGGAIQSPSSPNIFKFYILVNNYILDSLWVFFGQKLLSCYMLTALSHCNENHIFIFFCICLN